MAANSVQFTSVPNVGMAKFVNSDGTNRKTIFTPGVNGGRLHSISVSSDNTATSYIILEIVSSSINYPIGRVLIPAASVSMPLQIVTLFDPSVLVWLNPDDSAISLPTGVTVVAGMESAVASTKTVTVVAFGGNY